MSGFLFDNTPDPAPLAQRLQPKLEKLAQRGVYFGTSSWKYEGWLDTIYRRERYMTRAKFSAKKFDSECLREYAETFPVAGGDFSFYQSPSQDYWDNLFKNTPDGFGFGLKVPEHLTVCKWPEHARYGKVGGTWNDHFLDAEYFRNVFLHPLIAHRKKVPVLMFEFGAFNKDIMQVDVFLDRLGAFFEKLPRGWNYSVEIRNEDFMVPEYFALLAHFGVAHVHNAWTKMPTLSEQIARPETFTASFIVVRALLQKGCSYEQAVNMFEPYRKIQQPDPRTRTALAQIARHAIKSEKPAYLFVNNRLEGNAPGTIDAVTEEIV